ncbi:MAG: L-seryl-tRNA(Sec) selenium transferase [Planctomycetes bacterium]|nr:L-seryl-tRNA(Sec) selenium transferase [Planctomycetota bacterium]
MKNSLRRIPSVHQILSAPEMAQALSKHPRSIVTRAVRNVLQGLRSDVRSGKVAAIPTMAGIAEQVAAEAARLSLGRFCPVINATGIIIHTGLGRAPLPDAAIEEIARTAGGYLALEFDLDSGERGSRQRQIAQLLCDVTSAEAGMVVNNNAAAVLLGLDTLARDKEVIVSRSELVEIGGSFRMPDVMVKGGAKLVEVGTTNKTRIDDYRRAITCETALLLKVHQSNFRMVGFTQTVTEEELVALGREFNIPVMHDAGSGAMEPMRTFGFPQEPLIRHSVQVGIDVTTYSADKLLSGPQAGIIVGKAEITEKLKANPLARALRPGKLTLAALEATLRLYLDDDLALSHVPVFQMMAMSPATLLKRARKLARLIKAQAAESLSVQVEDGASAVGGGSLPGEELPTKVVSVALDGVAAESLAERLRRHMPPIIARVRDDRVVFDTRTIAEDELNVIASAFASFRPSQT